MKRKVRVTTAQGSNEVVLKGLDGMFCSIAAMDVSGCELVGDFFVKEAGL